MPVIGTTALVIALPAAEPLLAAARDVSPELVRPGLVAQVTALYPFLPAAELTADVEQAVLELAATTPVTEVALTELVGSPGFLAAAAPALQPLADAACARWPHVPPYGGRFGPRPRAHLTVAMGANEDELARAAVLARARLPLTARADALHLVVLTGDGWRLRLAFPFAQP
ncbi:2'-5' RNA ligase family protein [Amycolatopsis sp. H20-H5]|uniref:2'-5' RNA ligase family protein n=1 Tax=Amycolatopsis sp. H20-H5 TaxID=3046309 RepID=UPI002DB940BD|nr:2'-5' RNA ligase family protein [Amycolatopsis sp. H20-H5]MEC3980713.1 2'-5' RNA ligase family protein [Amycolatopsis sp. H20-H5]